MKYYIKEYLHNVDKIFSNNMNYFDTLNFARKLKKQDKIFAIYYADTHEEKLMKL